MPLNQDKRGLLTAILAFGIWGSFPVYWKLLNSIAPIELLYTRLILTSIACLVLLPVRGTFSSFVSAWGSPKTIRVSMQAALLLSGNWFSFIWAVNSGNILESSLGYFLCPIVTVLLGRFVLKERMTRGRWTSVALAAAGVAVIIQMAGRVPMAALVIAATWSGYGLLKKQSSLGPVVSLGLEASLLSPVAVVALLWMSASGPMTLAEASPGTMGILAISGFVTATPLLLFAYAAPRIRLGTIGMGQYIVPTCHFMLAFAYGENIGIHVILGFALIWTGLVLYAVSAPDNE